jgi:hypothetical protein
MYSRNELAAYYSDYYKDLFGRRPSIDPEINRAGLVDLIEELDFVTVNDFS